MKQFLLHLANTGITPQLTSRQARTVSFLIMLTFLVLLLIVLNFPLPLAEVSHTTASKILLLVLTIHFILIALTLLFNHLKKYNTARIYFGPSLVSAPAPPSLRP